MDRATPRMEHCPLCGIGFGPEGQGCRSSCPLAKGCRVVCCPACHYSFPQETGLARALRGLVDRMKEKKAAR
jgi:hypothetical protein